MAILSAGFFLQPSQSVIVGISMFKKARPRYHAWDVMFALLPIGDPRAESRMPHLNGSSSVDWKSGIPVPV
ncbi:MAG: hypothetical protein R3C12_22955 [Planctomycetaceae bacterium]|nr:hypothetical protein [Planctomycetaceae bacterium]